MFNRLIMWNNRYGGCDRTEGANVKAGLLAAGAVLAALLASLCCIGPLIAAALGISSIGLATTFQPYRPWLIGLAIVLLAAGFYVLRRKRTYCGAATCATGVRIKMRRVWPALLVLVVTSLLLVPQITALWRGHHVPDPTARSKGDVTVPRSGLPDPACCLPKR